MDRTPVSFGRRSQKRPHSPQEERPAVEPKVSSIDHNPVVPSESKQNKLLRLLGGKKRKNEAAASKWLERVRTREEEIKLSTDLETQFNESLTHKLSGHAYRHTGIGFHDDVSSFADRVTNSSETAKANTVEKSKEIVQPSVKSQPKTNSMQEPSSNLKSILKKGDKVQLVVKPESSKIAGVVSEISAPKQTMQPVGRKPNPEEGHSKPNVKSKYDFYSQFKKAS